MAVTGQPTCVLDASAVLAWLRDEGGAEVVDPMLDHSLMSAVNFAEVLQKAAGYSIDVSGLREDLEALGVRLVPFDADLAYIAASLHPQAAPLGLGLADRACLALAAAANLPAVTADQAWKSRTIPVEVLVIR
jgi:PIN domain nuclease of toxin-antitoxin system